MLGGLVRLFAEKRAASSEQEKTERINSGILFSSGLIAGEGLVGIVLAVLAVLSVSARIDLSGWLNTGTVGGILLLLLIVLAIMKATVWRREGAR